MFLIQSTTVWGMQARLACGFCSVRRGPNNVLLCCSLCCCVVVVVVVVCSVTVCVVGIVFLTPAGSHVRVVFTTVKSTLWQRTRIATPGIATGRATRARASAFVIIFSLLCPHPCKRICGIFRLLCNKEAKLFFLYI